MRFRIDGVEYESPDDIRVRELVEAEKALGFSMDETGTGGKLAIGIYVAIRRSDPDIGPGMLADKVGNIEIQKFEGVKEESPPAVGGNGVAPENQRTSGIPRLAVSE